MNDKAIGYLIGLGLIIFLIIKVAIVAAIAAAIFAVSYFIYKGIKNLISYRHRISIYKIFKLYLENNYSIGIDLNHKEKIELKLSRIIIDIFFKKKLLNNIDDDFKRMSDGVSDGLNTSSVWACEVKDSNLQHRKDVTFNNNAFLKIDEISDTPEFTLCLNNSKLHIMPRICFYETETDIQIIEWSNINIAFRENKYIEEHISGIRGSSPVHYNYLHQRVDGGPDRRYNYNPATPVYCHAIYRLVIGKDEFNIVFASFTVAKQFVQLFSTFKKKILTVLNTQPNMVDNFDVTNDEYASLFRQIIQSKGRHIIAEKSFISILNDYKVFRTKRNMRTILTTLTDDNYWKDILSPDCTYDTLNDISDRIVSTYNYDDTETMETLAYIGYGLQLK